MASAHGHLNNEVMNNNRPPAPKFRKWLMRNNKSSLSGLTSTHEKTAIASKRGVRRVRGIDSLPDEVNNL